MKVLIIYAHPNPKSFNHAILEEVKRGLTDGKHSLNVIDLYEDNFNPVLVYGEKMKRSDLENDSEIINYKKLIQEAEHLIFIYPVWWYGTPAILKGFIDRVFVSGFAYTNKGKFPQGLFGGKSAWVVYTIDSPSWFVKLFRSSMEWTVMKTAILRYCGIKRAKRLMFAGVKGSNTVQRQKWLEFIYSQAYGSLT